MTLAYRVFVYDPKAKPGQGGHPGHLHRPQRTGRIDNANHYDTWYLSEKPEGAIGEVFGNLDKWSDDMFLSKFVPGGRRVLGVFDIPDDTPLLDLDDANNLLYWGLRPRQVVIRDRPTTQTWALRMFRESDGAGQRKYDGVKWWSFQRPQWTVYGVWVPPGETPTFTYLHHEDLSLSHYAIENVRRSLAKPAR
ncbi:hypothetical protein IWX65_003493 [Arthrobacter sp. CAN_A214]|uniref:RES domain-containing protein n=1 Tax=Arthrobacter sp. CAN_A214 TaxID=2787720 RepID=UPI0018CAD329